MRGPLIIINVSLFYAKQNKTGFYVCILCFTIRYEISFLCWVWSLAPSKHLLLQTEVPPSCASRFLCALHLLPSITGNQGLTGFFNFGSGKNILGPVGWWVQIAIKYWVNPVLKKFIGYLSGISLYFPYLPHGISYFTLYNILYGLFGCILAPTGALYAMVVNFRSGQP